VYGNVRPASFEHLSTVRVVLDERYRLDAGALHAGRHGTDATEEIEMSHQYSMMRMMMAHSSRLGGIAASTPRKKFR